MGSFFRVWKIVDQGYWRGGVWDTLEIILKTEILKRRRPIKYIYHIMLYTGTHRVTKVNLITTFLVDTTSYTVMK